MLKLPLVLAFACLPATAAAQELVAYKRVEIDLGGPSFKQMLPFDVPFLLTGTAPAGIRTIAIKHRERSANTGGHGCGLQSALWPDSATWRRSLSESDAAATFSLLFDPVAAKTDYEFCIILESNISEQEQDTARARARRRIDRVLRNQPLTAWTQDSVDVLRDFISEEVRSTLGVDRIIAPGTLFDAQVSESDAWDRVRNTLRATIPEAQANRSRIIDDWKRDAAAFESTLTRAVSPDDGSDILHQVFQHLRVTAVTNASLKALLEDAPLKSALALLNADPSGLALWARGETGIPVGTTRARVADAYTPAEAALVRSNYESIRDALFRLHRFFREVSDPGYPYYTVLDSLIRENKLTPADVVAFQQAVSDGGPVAAALLEAEQMIEVLTELEERLAARERGLDALAGEFDISSRDARVSRSQSFGNLTSYRSWYASADVGFAVLPDLGEAVPYLGMNLYFRPVNRDAPLGPLFSLRSLADPRRWSVTLGVALESLAQNGRRKDLFGTTSLLVGPGWRLHEVLRFGGGFVMFQKIDDNPLHDNASLSVTWYLNASLDLHVPDIPLLDRIF